MSRRRSNPWTTQGTTANPWHNDLNEFPARQTDISATEQTPLTVAGRRALGHIYGTDDELSDPGQATTDLDNVELRSEQGRSAAGGFNVYSYADTRPGTPTQRFPRGGRSPRSWWAQWRHRVAYYIPVLAWMPNYFDAGLSAFIGDLVTGLSVACLIVPQSLSYAGLAGLSPMQGIWTAFAPPLTYSLLGTSRQLSVGPEALVAMLSGAAIAEEESIANGK
jgi:hypothetical protein